MTMWRYFIPVALLAVLAGFFWRGLYMDPGVITSPLIGQPAPTFSLPSVRDPAVIVSSANFKGEVALVNVWGTWCVECRHEHAFLLEIEKSGVPIYGLNVRDDRASAIEWLDRLGDPYVDSAFDDDGKVAVDWGVYGAPETFLIGRDGTILHKHISPLTPTIWREDFVPLIEKECGALPCPPGGED
jgi:cytochrome c biogenesis protein CcmG/thiol:disulfide interchange protein DsbE